MPSTTSNSLNCCAHNMRNIGAVRGSYGGHDVRGMDSSRHCPDAGSCSAASPTEWNGR